MNINKSIWIKCISLYLGLIVGRVDTEEEPKFRSEVGLLNYPNEQLPAGNDDLTARLKVAMEIISQLGSHAALQILDTGLRELVESQIKKELALSEKKVTTEASLSNNLSKRKDDMQPTADKNKQLKGEISVS